MIEPPSDRIRPAAPLEWLALAVALAPFVVAVVRAAVTGWIPVGDAAYFTVRSADVLTAHHPLVGAWSSGSAVVGVSVNNLGPLQLDVLAPFTKVSPDLGTAIGSALINAASVTVVWLAVRRMFRPAVVVAVMAGTTLFVAALGLSWLIDARQQSALVLPLFALLWLSAAMWAGVGIAVPIAVVLASLIIQTHFTFGYPAGLVFLAGLVGFVLTTRTSPGAWRKTAGWSLVLGVLCWIQPVIDQIAGTGNLGDVLGRARGRPGAGLEVGVQVLAGAALVPPFWLPASMRTFLLPGDGISLPGAVIAVVVWLIIAGGVAVLGWRAAVPAVTATGVAGLVAIVAGVVAAARIPVSSFGLVPQNYYWVWSLAAFVTIAAIIAACSLPMVVKPLRVGSPWQRRALLAVVAVAALCVAVWPRYPVASVAVDEVEARRVGRPLRAQLAAAIEAGVVPDHVEVDLSRAFFANDHPYVMLAALQRAGIEFGFRPGSGNLDRFGESRCVEAGRFQRLLLIAGADPELAPGSVIVAEVVGITDTELAEYAALQRRFGELLRDDIIDVGGLADADVAPGPVDELAAVLTTPELPATGLARHLDGWQRSGIVSIPAAVGEDFARWLQLEQRSSADYQTIVLEQPSVPDNRAC
ncbi:MAG: hypothetical protein ABWZ99_08175 [Ilumatobacteraceae bacterium]